MRHFALGSVLLLASAQLGLAATFNVVVGGAAGLKFVPDNVNASVGDVILFTFQQKNHTVTQSTLASPCIPLSLTQPNGFDSGFRPVPDNQTSGFPMASLTVKQTTPIWAFCRQGNHCSQGMVFAVNPGSDLATFHANAVSAGSPPTVSSATSPVSTTVPSSNDHRVIVGGAGILAFQPSTVAAQPGDTITFEFRQKNHTVTSSTFENPCHSNNGFDSGFQPVADAASSFPTWVLPVNDTKPIWVYCRQGNHCTSGMVFAANSVESSAKNFNAFQEAAKQSGNSTSSSSSPYGTGAAWRPSVGSSSIAVVLALSAAGWLL